MLREKPLQWPIKKKGKNNSMTCKMTREIYDKLSLTLLYNKREFILLHSVLINGVVKTMKKSIKL